MRDLSHHQLRSIAALCSGTALMLAIAVFMGSGYSVASNQSQTATLGCTIGFSCTAGWSYFYAAPSTIDSGQSARIHASAATSGTSCWIWRSDNPGGLITFGNWDVNFSTGALTSNKTYVIQCKHGSEFSTYGTVAVTVVPAPTATIGASVTSIRMDQTSTISATFAAPSGDSLTGTNIDSPEGTGLTPTTDPQGGASKSYVFSPTSPGVATFYARIMTASRGWASYANVSVNVLPQNPTVSISGNDTNPTSVVVGTPVTIKGAFRPGAKDTLTKTALNDSNNVALSGVAWTPPTDKTYTFTPSTVGTYTFYPAVQTSFLPAWNNYGASLKVTATCPTGQIVGTGGTCSTPHCSGTHEVNYPTCSCESGYVRSGSGNAAAQSRDNLSQNGSGQCVPGVCAGAHQVGYPTCSCDVGYSMQSGQCAVQPPSISTPLKATPARVVKGQQTSLSWSTTGIAVGGCSLRNNKGVVLSLALSATDFKVTVGELTTFTLSCLTGSALNAADGGGQSNSGPTLTSSVTVTVVPSFQEL